MHTNPTSSGPRSMIMRIRLPVTSRRRCEQITAFGASDVPDVKISAHGVSTSGSSPGSSVPTASSAGSAASRSTTSTGGSSSRIDASSSRCRASVTTRPQSVWLTSRSRCSPRRVWLRPTTAPPTSAAPPNANRYSGRLSSSTATWRGRPSGRRSRKRFAQRHDSLEVLARGSRPGRRTGSRAAGRCRDRRRCAAGARRRWPRRAAPARARARHAGRSGNLTSASL